jgi:hypothetical protein
MNQLATRLVMGAACMSCVVSACVSRPGTRFPMLHAVGNPEKALDCGGLEDQIERADAVRWAIRESGVRLPASKRSLATEATVVVLEVATMVALQGACCVVGGIGNGPQYSLARADERVEQLLRLKRDRSCRANPTGLSGVSDSDALDRLEGMARQYRAGEIRELAYLRQRTQLLDSLRDPASLTPAETVDASRE